MSRKNGHRKLATATAEREGTTCAFETTPDEDRRLDELLNGHHPQLAALNADGSFPDPLVAVINLPIDTIEQRNARTGYSKRFHKVELRLGDLAPTFQRLYYALHDRNVRLASGRHIDNHSDVLRYLLEQYAAATQ